MRRVIAAINMTLDGFGDHTAVNPDEDIHQHYTDLLNSAGVILYGRITYGLMEYWRTILANPTGIKSMDEFAVAIDNIPKIVFSNTLKTVDWETATLAKRDIREEIAALKTQPGKDIFVGSPTLIVTMTQLGLIDELQLCIHPVLAAGGTPLFKNLHERRALKLIRTKTFACGAIILYYEPAGQGERMTVVG